MPNNPVSRPLPPRPITPPLLLPLLAPLPAKTPAALSLAASAAFSASTLFFSASCANCSRSAWSRLLAFGLNFDAGFGVETEAEPEATFLCMGGRIGVGAGVSVGMVAGEELGELSSFWGVTLASAAGREDEASSGVG